TQTSSTRLISQVGDSLIDDCRHRLETLRRSACPGRFLYWPGMRVTDGNPSRQVPPRGLGARQGSTRLGQKELALLVQCEPRRGNVYVPSALPPERPMARRSLLSRGSDQGHRALQAAIQEVVLAA